MSTKYRGTSPTHAKKVIPEEIQLQAKAAEAAFKKRNVKNQSFFDKYSYQIVIGGFIAIIVFILGNHFFFSKSKRLEDTLVNDVDDIEQINGAGYSFKVGPVPSFNDINLADVKNQLNSQLFSRQNINQCLNAETSSIIETSYDFRTTHENCVTSVYESGNCSAGYATSVASTISNRNCRRTGELVNLSPQVLIDCDEGHSQACRGGYVSRGFDYAKKNGLPTTDSVPFTGEQKYEKCANVSSENLSRTQEVCHVTGIEMIQREIFASGPVVSVIPVYRDFLIYKEGIYEVKEGQSPLKAFQTVKIIGWGQENKRTYWIIENSWGTSWGENGYARIYANQSTYLPSLEMYALSTAVPVSQPVDGSASANQ